MKTVGAKRGERIFRVFVVLMLLCVACGCGGGGGNTGGIKSNTTPAGPPDTGGNQSAAASLSVTLVDEAGDPVPDVAVAVDGGASQLTSDSAGRITVPVPSVAAQGTPVRLALSRGGYVPLQQTVRVYPGAVSGGVMETTIMMPREPSSAESGTQAEVIGSDGGATMVIPVESTDAASGLPVTTTTVAVTEFDRAVTFSAAPFDGKPPAVSLTIGDPSGTGDKAAEVLGFTGALTGSITYGDPTSPDALAMFPGEFETGDDTGTGAGAGVLITAGFARITLTNGSGQPVTSFAGGAAVTVTMRVPAGVTNPETGAPVAAGDTIPVFSFNETTGEWIVEHEAGGGVKRTTVQQDADGLFVTFSLTHLTWINLDWKDDICPVGKPRVNFVDENGAPVSGVNFSAWASGWNFQNSQSVFAKDSYVEFASAPASVKIYVQASKDTFTSKIVELNNCSDATINIKSCTNACTDNWQCNDGNSNTLDYCMYTTGSCPVCINPLCSIGCSSDAQCDDGNATTTDKCAGPGSCYSYCYHPAPCSPRCSANSDCDDGNVGTTDTCSYPGTCSAQCYHKQTCAACYSNADCNDNNSNTIDTCRNPNTCSAACEHCNVVCTNNADCDDGNLDTGDVCSRPNSCSEESCSHFPCEVACASDAQCDDDNPFTTDACANPGTCDAACSHTSCVACGNDTQCDDGDALTIDTCANPGTCAAACSNISCVACTQDMNCDDGDIYTRDACVNPGTCSSSCTNTPCTVACMNNIDCDDGNGFTNDECANPATCDAACSNTSCSAACAADMECDDGNPATTDVCYNPGTCAASCGSPTSGLSVDVGMNFACAVRVDGTVQCWGNNQSGNLGDGTTNNAASPVNVLNVAGATHAGAGCSTGVALQANGSYMCWGWNQPMVSECDEAWTFYTPPSEVFSIPGATAMYSSLSNYCFIMGGGSVKCWGRDYSYSSLVDIAGINGATKLAAGYGYDCALIGDQTVRCWGDNTYGQLGDGTYASSTIPVFVSGLSGVTDIDASMLSIVLGAEPGGHTCAAMSGGGMKCWGSNANGQLGDGTYATSSVPVDVSGITTAVGVCAGAGYSCAVLADSTVKCWGTNSQGELGNGTTTPTNTPVAVSGLTGVADVSCGYGMTCVLMAGGGIKCWGNYEFGYLGNGNTLQGSLVPVDVIGF